MESEFDEDEYDDEMQNDATWGKESCQIQYYQNEEEDKWFNRQPSLSGNMVSSIGINPFDFENESESESESYYSESSDSSDSSDSSESSESSESSRTSNGSSDTLDEGLSEEVIGINDISSS